jgi:ATP-dependent Lon protease
MEVIEVSGYVAEEKLAIAKVMQVHDVLKTRRAFVSFQNYLIPFCIKQTAVKAENITITDAALMRLIKAYCRESGVRNLQKHIEKVEKALSARRDRILAMPCRSSAKWPSKL